MMGRKIHLLAGTCLPGTTPGLFDPMRSQFRMLSPAEVKDHYRRIAAAKALTERKDESTLSATQAEAGSCSDHGGVNSDSPSGGSA